MTKTILILAIAAAFVAGTLMANPVVEAASPVVGLLTDSIFGLEAIKNAINGIDTSGLATQSSVDALQADVDDIKSAQATQIQADVVLKNIVCGIATSPAGCVP